MAALGGLTEFGWASTYKLFSGTAKEYNALPEDDPLRVQVRELVKHPLEFRLKLDASLPSIVSPAQDFYKNKLTYGFKLPVQGISKAGEDAGKDFGDPKLCSVLIHDDGTITPNVVSYASEIRVSQPPVGNLRWSKKSLGNFVDGKSDVTIPSAVAQKIKGIFEEYVEFPTHKWATFAAVYCIASYYYVAFPAFAYWHLKGFRQGGKTKTLKGVAALAFNGTFLTDPSEAATFRLVEAMRPTLCIDELDGLDFDEKRTTMALLRHGYKSGQGVPRVEGKEPRTLVFFQVYSPKVIASNYSLPQVSDRCIETIMVRTTNAAILSKPDPDTDDPRFQELRDQLYLFAMQHWREVVEVWKAQYTTLRQDKELNLQMDGRAWELWSPLLATAKVLGEEHFQDLIDLAREVETKRHEGEADAEPACVLAVCIAQSRAGITNRLLEDIRGDVLQAFPDLYESDAKQAQGQRTRIGHILGDFELPKKRHGKGTVVTLDADRLDDLKNRYGVSDERIKEVAEALVLKEGNKEMKNAS